MFNLSSETLSRQVVSARIASPVCILVRAPQSRVASAIHTKLVESFEQTKSAKMIGASEP